MVEVSVFPKDFQYKGLPLGTVALYVLSSFVGFSVDDEEMEAGVRCVAALVFDHRQQVVAAISISGAAMRISPERIENIGKKVKQCALDISRDLGF